MADLPALTLEQMRRDIAEVLGESIDAIVPGEDLVDLGLDSIRVMSLAERWSVAGARITFEDLAEPAELQQWWTRVSRRRSGQSS